MSYSHESRNRLNPVMSNVVEDLGVVDIETEESANGSHPQPQDHRVVHTDNRNFFQPWGVTKGDARHESDNQALDQRLRSGYSSLLQKLAASDLGTGDEVPDLVSEAQHKTALFPRQASNSSQEDEELSSTSGDRWVYKFRAAREARVRKDNGNDPQLIGPWTVLPDPSDGTKVVHGHPEQSPYQRFNKANINYIFCSFQRARSTNDNLPADFELECEEVLQREGYTRSDLESWLHIADASDPDLATVRLGELSKTAVANLRPPPPMFFLSQVLRVDNLSAYSVNALLRGARKRIKSRTSSEEEVYEAGTFRDTSTALIVSVRLLRHARSVAAGIIPEVTSFACDALESTCQLTMGSLRNRRSPFLTRSFNEMLSLLALPCPNRPFKTTTIRRRAQLIVQQRMAAYDPPLLVNRTGHRGLISVALTMKKTPDEKLWADVLAPSWPPWRQWQIGLDEDREYAGEYSHAYRMLVEMRRQGYASGSYDLAGMVLAGRDTDQTPTIQTRAFRAETKLQRRSTSGSVEDAGVATLIPWDARILATRTLREAWNCFLAFRNTPRSEQAPLLFDVYHALFQKLVAPVVDQTRGSRARPGDGRETFPEPESPRSKTHISSPVPTVAQAYQMMLTDEVKPAGRLLALLMGHAETLEEGLRYLQDSRLGELKTDILLSAEKYSQQQIRHVIQSMPSYLFAAYLRLLLFVDQREPWQFFPPASSATITDEKLAAIRPSRYAIDLCRISGTSKPEPWEALLKKYRSPRKHNYGLILSRLPFAPGLNSRPALSGLTRILKEMETCRVPATISTMNIILELSITVLMTAITTLNDGTEMVYIAQNYFEKLVHGSAEFDGWLHNTADKALLEVPEPRTLMLLFQLCCTQRWFQSVLDLLDWMQRFEPELRCIRDEENRGADVLYDTLTMIKIFFEARWHDLPDSIFAASDEQLAKARGVVDSVPAWGGWPSDEEVSRSLEEHSAWYTQLRHRMFDLYIIPEEGMLEGGDVVEEDVGTFRTYQDTNIRKPLYRSVQTSAPN